MEIQVLVGCIASGKSSYAKQKAKEGCIIINDDSIVNAVHGGNYTLYDKWLKPLYKSIEDHILHMAVAINLDVVIDRGVDISTTSRQRWIAIGRSLGVPVRCICFEVFPPEVHAQRRAESDARGYSYEYWLDVAKAHAARYNEPTLAEGFAEIEHQKWKP